MFFLNGRSCDPFSTMLYLKDFLIRSSMVSSIALQPAAVPHAEIRRASIPLTQLARGRKARVSETNLEPDDLSMLRAMGLKPNATIEVCRMGQPCIVALEGICGGGCRIGLSREIAARVMVQPQD